MELNMNEIIELLERAVEKTLMPIDDGDGEIARRMHESWNRGVKSMFNTALASIYSKQFHYIETKYKEEESA